MQIQSGKLYKNRTYDYLYPCLKAYGDDLVKQLNQFFKIGIGIGDNNIVTSSDCIFILFDLGIPMIDSDKVKYRENFSRFLDLLRSKSYYYTDYMYNRTGMNQQHMVVLKIPPIHEKSFGFFIKGEYSKMYTPRELNSYFIILPNPKDDANIKLRNLTTTKARSVFVRTPERIKEFVDIVNKEYGTWVTIKDYKDAELDYPITLEDEIFNL